MTLLVADLPLRWRGLRIPTNESEDMQDLRTIRQALKEALQHSRGVAGGLLLADIVHSLNLKSLRDRMEAVGGGVVFSSTPAGPALIAELDLANTEPASG